MTNFLIGYPDIPQNSTITASKTADTSFPLKNLITGSRGKSHQLSTSTTDDYYIQCDRGSGNTSSSNYAAIQRAKLLQQGNVNAFRLRGSTQPYNLPSTITGLKLWLDATRGITADGSNRVSQWDDQSGLGNNATQATDGNKPVLTRADNKENLLKFSEELENAVWQLSNVNATLANQVANPLDGEVTADQIRENTATADHHIYQSSNIVSGVSYTLSCYLKSNGRNARIIASGAAISPSAIYAVDLTNGSTITATGGTAYSTESLGNGWYRLSVTFTATGTGNCDSNIRLLNGTSTSYLGDGSSGVYAYGCQLRHATADSTYLSTTLVPGYAGKNGNRALLFLASASQIMTANGAAATFSGVDKPFTLGIAFKKRTNSGTQNFFALGRASSTTPVHQIYTNGSSNYATFRRDDASANASASGGTPDLGWHIITVAFTGTTISLWVDGSNAINGAALNVGTATLDTLGIGAWSSTSILQPFDGFIGEVCLYDTSLGTSDRQNLEAYLTSKWSTAASLNMQTLDTATLYGPRSEDYVSSFSASTAYRYWWAQYGASSSGSKYPHSKLHFGSWFDFGREPIYPMLQKREAYSSGSREARYIFECEWQGITDSVMEDFIDKIVKYKDVSPVILYDASDYCLNDMRQMHAWLTSAEFDKTSHNSNTIRCVFEEAL